ncbi:MAG: hypothetical protein MN733_38290 [Nitrososphaera sp.]|nr:hypothetical protein [Nitrososphaera sp.]
MSTNNGSDIWVQDGIKEMNALGNENPRYQYNRWDATKNEHSQYLILSRKFLHSDVQKEHN